MVDISAVKVIEWIVGGVITALVAGFNFIMKMNKRHHDLQTHMDEQCAHVNDEIAKQKLYIANTYMTKQETKEFAKTLTDPIHSDVQRIDENINKIFEKLDKK